TELLRNLDPRVRGYAARGLGYVGSSTWVGVGSSQTLAKEDEAPDDGLRGRGPRAARTAVPALLAALADDDPAVAKWSRWTLADIDPAALAAYDREHPQEGRP